MNPSPRSTLSVLCGLALILPVSLAQEAAADSQLRKAVTEIPHRVLFESKLDGDYDLYVMNADGTGRKNLTNTDGVDEVNGKASPDGRHIVYVRDSSEDGTRVRDVYLMAVDGSDQRKIADDARDPCWSPDSKRVAFLPAEYRRFTTSTWATRGLRIYDLESGKTTDHPNEEIEHLYSLAWTPDGKWFVATVMGGMGFRQGILAVEADGQGVFDLGLSGCRPDITSDGGRIAWGYGDYSIGVARLDLSGERPRAARGKRAVYTRWRRGLKREQTYHADWSPESKYLVFSRGPKVRTRRMWGAMPQNPGEDAPGWDIAIADAETGEWVELTTDGKGNKEPDWIPVRKEDQR